MNAEQRAETLRLADALGGGLYWKVLEDAVRLLRTLAAELAPDAQENNNEAV